MLSISRLTDRIRYVLQCNTNGNPEESRNGQLCPNRIWRGPILHEEKLFFKAIPSANGDLSIDILLDASCLPAKPSGGNCFPRLYDCRKSDPVWSSGYWISSYCSIEGCTVLHIFRDYQETDKMTVFFNIWLPDGIGTVWPSVWLVNRSCLPLMSTVYLLFCLTATPTMTFAFSPQKVLFHSSTIMAGNVVLSIPPGKSAISAVRISVSLLYARGRKKICLPPAESMEMMWSGHLLRSASPMLSDT